MFWCITSTGFDAFFKTLTFAGKKIVSPFIFTGISPIFYGVQFFAYEFFLRNARCCHTSIVFVFLVAFSMDSVRMTFFLHVFLGGQLFFCFFWNIICSPGGGVPAVPFVLLLFFTAEIWFGFSSHYLLSADRFSFFSLEHYLRQRGILK